MNEEAHQLVGQGSKADSFRGSDKTRDDEIVARVLHGGQDGGLADMQIAPEDTENLLQEVDMSQQSLDRFNNDDIPDRFTMPSPRRCHEYLLYYPCQFCMYIRRLSDAFGWKFIFICCATYGANQGIGVEWGTFAMKYYFADTLKVSPARAAALRGFVILPWQIKALYGMMQDMIPIMGWHRTPYILIAGVVGMLSWGALFLVPMTPIAAVFFLIIANYGIASPDVAVDAAVAERAKTHPELAPDMQALCWGALSIGGLLAAVTVGSMQAKIGDRQIFGLNAFTGLSIAIPAALGFMQEQREPPHRRNRACDSIKEGFRNPVGKWVFYTAIAVSICSVFLGLLAVLETSHNSDVINGSLTLACAVCVVAPAVWLFLRRVSPVLAKASTFIFLREALQPSTSVLFYWYRRTEENCKKGYPCLDPEFIGLMDAVAYVFLLCGTIVYQKFFSKWTYRGIFILAQVLLVGFNLLDLIWVTRLNVKLGISDKLFLFGEEVFGPILMRLALMPMLILSAKLCPPGVEATLFALNMGLSNFGVSVGRYLGVFCLEMFGGIEGPEFKNLQWFVLLRSLTRFIPILFVHQLVPKGTPTDDARAMSERNVGGDCGGSDVRESKENQESSISLEDIGHGDRKKGWRRVDLQESLEIVDDEDE